MKSILEEALEVSGQNRQRDYGHPLVNHERIAAVWNVVLGPKLSKPITPEEVVWCMIGVKLAREVNTPKRDNALDVAGYVNCLDLIQQERFNKVLEKTFETDGFAVRPKYPAWSPDGPLETKVA